MGEGIRGDTALGLALQRVIAHGIGGGQPLFDIALFQNAEVTVGVIGPDTGIAVRL